MRLLCVLLLGAVLSACPSTENTSPATPNPDFTNTNDGGVVQAQTECAALTEPGQECNSTCECLANGCSVAAVCTQLNCGAQYCACLCLENSDCNSGCCLELTGGDAKVCAPASACQPSACAADAGTSTSVTDAGQVETEDGGAADAGPEAGDAGSNDGGVTDAGTSVADAGSNAEEDAGVDAGLDTDAGADGGDAG